MSESVKLLSVNVRGLSNFKKRRAIFTWCRKRNADFIFLQETHLHVTIEHETCWRHEWGAEIISTPGTSDARGVAVLFLGRCWLQNTLEVVGPRGEVHNSQGGDSRKACSSD